MGIVSVVLIGTVPFFVWLTVSTSRLQAPERAPANLAASVRSATSCEALRTVCSSLAAVHDDHSNYFGAQNKMVDRILGIVIALVIGWAGASAAAFFYIFKSARQRPGADVAL